MSSFQKEWWKLPVVLSRKPGGKTNGQTSLEGWGGSSIMTTFAISVWLNLDIYGFTATDWLKIVIKHFISESPKNSSYKKNYKLILYIRKNIDFSFICKNSKRVTKYLGETLWRESSKRTAMQSSLQLLQRALQRYGLVG